jgi:wobble nucleotide-excising tRNase
MARGNAWPTWRALSRWQTSRVASAKPPPLSTSLTLWINKGLGYVKADNNCPFCTQNLANIPIIEHYKGFFSQGYNHLKQSVATAISSTAKAHDRNVATAFERAAGELARRREFWRQYTDLPALSIDTAAVVRHWNAAREAVLLVLKSKERAPLEKLSLPAEAIAALETYDTARLEAQKTFETYAAENQKLAAVKESAAASNVAALRADIVRLRAIEARHLPENDALCNAYLAEKAAKR